MHSTAEMGVNSVPAFLTKIWTLVDDPETDELISWDPSGLSFHVHDQGRFAKEILPHYFKHSNIASFVRQLNMYGFRKVVHVDSGSIKRETDEVEFHHPYFVRGQEGLLEHIKRKTSQPQVTSSTLRTEAGLKFSHDDVTRVLNDVQLMKGKQEAFTSKMDKMKKENEALWREVASLRQKHVKQQQIVNKLIQFMIHLVGANRNTLSNTGIPKRKMPLMIGDSSQVPSPKKPRYTKQLSIEEVPDPQYDYIIKSPDSIPKPDSTDNLAYTTGPIIHDVTDSISPISTSSTSRINSPGKLTTTTAVPMKLPTRTNTDNILHSNIDTSQGLNLSSSDLNELVQNIDPAILDRSLDTNTSTLTDNIGTVDIPDKSQLNTQLDTLQFEIDSLKDMMTGDHFNFDPATILPLFNTDSSVPVSIENLLGELESSPLQTAQIPPQQSSGSIMGNELVQYQTPAELGIPDLSDIISIDQLPEEEQESEPIDPMSFINTNPVPVSQDDLSLDTPLLKEGEI